MSHLIWFPFDKKTQNVQERTRFFKIHTWNCSFQLTSVKLHKNMFLSFSEIFPQERWKLMILIIPNMVTTLLISRDKVKDNSQGWPQENIRTGEQQHWWYKNTRAEVKQNYATENQEVGSCCTVNSFKSLPLHLWKQKGETREKKILLYKRSREKDTISNNATFHRVDTQVCRDRDSISNTLMQACCHPVVLQSSCSEQSTFLFSKKQTLNFSLIEPTFFF